ncbi:PH domain-containing protein [Patescibacteria group bacterium]|nr:MAG: PH domain-containing protein [Patescibacteria group bacterium]
MLYTSGMTEKHKYFDDQFPDEEMIHLFRKHPIVMRKGLIFGMLGPLVGILPASIRPELGFGWFFGGLAGGVVLGLLVFFPSWIAWYFSVFILTDQRLIQVVQKGLFRKSVVDISLSQIQMVNYEVSGVEQTLLGFGTITIQTYVGDLVVHYVHHPDRIQKTLLGVLRDQGIITINRTVEPEETDEEES